MKCELFCNYHCITDDCPSIQADAFEEKYDLPASEIGLERIPCSKCIYNDKRCTCDDCYFQGGKECPQEGN